MGTYFQGSRGRPEGDRSSWLLRPHRDHGSDGQNTLGVEGIHHVPPDFTRRQIDAVFKDIVPGVVKIGRSPDV